jgi:hypothetical protein
MDTMTYASVAVLPWSIAQDRTRPVRAEVEYIRLDLSMIKRWRPSDRGGQVFGEAFAKAGLEKGVSKSSTR